MIKNCLNCNIEFKARLYDVRKGKGKFCSCSCSAIFNNKNRKPVTCTKCGNPAGRTKSGNRRKLCDNCFYLMSEVIDKTISELLIENKDGQNKYRKIRFNARYIMQKTGIPQVCNKCGYDKHVEVCHIKSIYSFDLDTKISIVNALTNLMYLCPNCHWEFDNLISQGRETASC